jgi:cathepsin L
MVVAEVIESGRYIATKHLIEMSVQQLIDCTKTTGNDGCNGGGMENTFDYIHRNGITSAAHYPFTGALGTCTYKISDK